ncbi:MAG: MarR family transcriptional regulator [Bacillota bacterium]|nr:MarR family transcriptional regulator [Bacillota bacterium]
MIKESSRLREYIRRIQRRLGLVDENGKSCCGITLSQCHSLVEIGRAGAISLVDLATEMGLDKSTLSRTVENLVQKGYAIRETDARNRRYVVIKLTEEGNSLFKGIEKGMDDYFDKIYQLIPEGKRAQVLESMQLMLEAVTKFECCQ